MGGGFGGSFGGSFGASISIHMGEQDMEEQDMEEQTVFGYRDTPLNLSDRWYLPENVLWTNVGSIQIAQPTFSTAASPARSQAQQKRECEAAGKKWVGPDAALGLSMLTQYSGGLSHIAQIPPGGVSSGYCRSVVNSNVCRLIAGATATFLGSAAGRNCASPVKATACFLVAAAGEAFACDESLLSASAHRGISFSLR